jgi:GTP-binding protein HflX
MMTASDPYLKVSALNDDDLERVKLAIQEKLMGGRRTFRIPADKGDMISLVYRVGDVLENEVDGGDMLFQVRINNREFDKVGYMLAQYDLAKETSGGESLHDV